VSDILLFDTNVVSYLFKKDSRGLLYERHLKDRLPVIAAQTLAELEAMPLLNNWGKRRHQELRVYLRKFVFVTVDEAVCLRWAEIRAHAKQKGRPISTGDAWIAAAAVAHAVPLLTHNPADFKNVLGLTIITES
jgi:tRNA(fMet)-specific endonuclease VapC